eukprot:m.37540 g.37540  ORF g.37540 m.37540 type:complete len:1089 (-) comp5842_c1_seq1:46-3312(-)
MAETEARPRRPRRTATFGIIDDEAALQLALELSLHDTGGPAARPASEALNHEAPSKRARRAPAAAAPADPSSGAAIGPTQAPSPPRMATAPALGAPSTAAARSRRPPVASGCAEALPEATPARPRCTDRDATVQRVMIPPRELATALSRSAVGVPHTHNTAALAEELALERPPKKARHTSKPAKPAAAAQASAAPQPATPGAAAQPQSSASASGSSGSGSKKTTPPFELPEAPVYYPTDAEFCDPLAYIEKIRAEAEQFGICKIVPPPMWQPVCCLNEAFSFDTKLQRLHQLYRRRGKNSDFLECLRFHLQSEGNSLTEIPRMGGVELDLYKLSSIVARLGGLQAVINKNRWGRIANELRIPQNAFNRETRLQGFYYKYLLSYDMLSDEEKQYIESQVHDARRARLCRRMQADGPREDDAFGFEEGKRHTLLSYKRFADEFKKTWYKTLEVPEGQLERDFWNILEKDDRHISVMYGSDIDSMTNGSGFPTDANDPYSRFGWNLNVLPGLPGSILKNAEGISGISMPWLYAGMVFATFCWHNEDNYLYSVNYMHFGDAKTWYGVPGSDAYKFEEVFRENLPNEFAQRPNLIHDIVTQLSPAKLTAGGVRVCRTVQRAREFVITFPQAYHAGFSHGFNCGEAVNFATADWLAFGYQATRDYRRQRRPVSLDHEKLVIESCRTETNKNTLWYLLVELKRILKCQRFLRDQLLCTGQSKTMSLAEYERDLAKQHQQQHAMATSVPPSQVCPQAHSGGRMASFSSASAAPAAPAAQPSKMRMMRPNRSDGSYHCSLCYHICHTSMVLATSQKTPEPAIMCLECALESVEFAASDMLFVYRHSLQSLEQLIADVEQRLGPRTYCPSPTIPADMRRSAARPHPGLAPRNEGPVLVAKEPIVANVPIPLAVPAPGPANRLCSFRRRSSSSSSSAVVAAAAVAATIASALPSMSHAPMQFAFADQPLVALPVASVSSTGSTFCKQEGMQSPNAGEIPCLTSLVCQPGQFSPSFQSSVTAYTLHVPEDTVNICITLTLSDSCCGVLCFGHHETISPRLTSGKAHRFAFPASHQSMILQFILSATHSSNKRVYSVKLCR